MGGIGTAWVTAIYFKGLSTKHAKIKISGKEFPPTNTYPAYCF
jgi:hypothetical protein